jgi:hypothetical protein
VDGLKSGAKPFHGRRNRLASAGSITATGRETFSIASVPSAY